LDPSLVRNTYDSPHPVRPANETTAEARAHEAYYDEGTARSGCSNRADLPPRTRAHRRPRRSSHLHWGDWFNHHRLLEVNADVPPVKLEQTYDRQHTRLGAVG
jgi:hypothetical protein